MKVLPTLTSALCFVSCVVANAQDSSRLATQWKNAQAIPTVSARAEINEKIDIAVDVPGTLITLNPSQRGGFVTAGQLVVEIDSDVAQAELAELVYAAESTILIKHASTVLDEEKFHLDQIKKANEETGEAVHTENEIRAQELKVLTSTAEVAKAKFDQGAAQKKVDTKNQQLEKFKRYSKISGIVTDLHGKAEGTSVTQGEPIMTIVDFEKMKVIMDVHSKYEPQVKRGDRVLIRRVLGGDSSSSEAAPNEFYKKNSGEAIKTRVQNDPVIKYFFEGVVTLTASSVKGDKASSFVVEAVVDNASVGVGNYLLKEGKVQARIIAR